MAVSRAGLERIVEKGQACSGISSPDDMWLGAVLKAIGVPLVHYPGFHQVRLVPLHGTC